MTRETAPSQRITQIREQLGLSYRDFAAPLGVSHSTVRRWENGGSDVNRTVALSISDCYNVSADWILTGEGKMTVLAEQTNLYPEPTRVSGVHETMLDYPARDTVEIPVYSLAASAGPGSIITLEPHIIAKMPFETASLRKRLCGVSFKDLGIVEVEGDSMAPDICTDDLIMFDKSAPLRPFRDGLWLFRLGDAVHVKRLQQVGPHTFEAHSTNPNYRTFSFDDEFQLLGRVVWSDRTW